MKNFYSVLFMFACLFLSMTANAQGTWAVGLQVGENLNSLTGDAESDARLGFTAGVHASHYLLENLVLRLEVNFERKGAENVFPTNPFAPDIPAEIRLDYLSLPILLRYTTPVGKARFAAGGGIGVSYLLREVSEFEEVAAVQTDDFNRVDADLLVCAGAGYPIGKQLTISLELRSIFGLVEVEKNPGTARQLGRNVSWGLLMGVNYYL